jgi:hypothetical protein
MGASVFLRQNGQQEGAPTVVRYLGGRELGLPYALMAHGVFIAFRVSDFPE